MLSSRIIRLSGDSSRKFLAFRKTNQLILEIKNHISDFNNLESSKVWEKLEVLTRLGECIETNFIELKALHPISSSSNFMLRKTQYIEAEKIMRFCVENLVESFAMETNAFYQNLNEVITPILEISNEEFRQAADEYYRALVVVAKLMRRCAYVESLAYNDFACEIFFKLCSRVEEIDAITAKFEEQGTILKNSAETLHGLLNGIAILYLEFAIKNKSAHIKRLLALVRKMFERTIASLNLYSDLKIIRMISGLSHVNALVYPAYQRQIEHSLHVVVNPDEPDVSALNRQLEIAITVQSQLDTNFEHAIQKRQMLEFQYQLKEMFKKRLSEINCRFCIPFFKSIFLRGYEVPMPFSLELLNYVEAFGSLLLKQPDMDEYSSDLNTMTYVAGIKGTLSKPEFDVISKIIYRYQIAESDLVALKKTTTDKILFNNFLAVNFFMTQPLSFLAGPNLEPFEYALYKTMSSYNFLANKFVRILIKSFTGGIKYSDYLGYNSISKKLELALKTFLRVLVSKHHEQNTDFNNNIIEMCHDAGVEFDPDLEMSVIRQLSRHTASEIYVIDSSVALFHLLRYYPRGMHTLNALRRVSQQVFDVWKSIKFSHFFRLTENEFHASAEFKIKNFCDSLKTNNYFYIENPSEEIFDFYETFIVNLSRFMVDWNVFLTNRRMGIRDFEETLKTSFKLARLHKICIATIEFFSVHGHSVVFIENEADLMMNFDYMLSLMLEELNYSCLLETYIVLTGNPAVSTEVKDKLNQTLIGMFQYFTQQIQMMSSVINEEELQKLIDFGIRVMGHAYDLPLLKPVVSDLVKAISEFKMSSLGLPELINICYLNCLSDMASSESMLSFILEIIQKYPAQHLKYNSKFDWQLEMTAHNVRLLEVLNLLQNDPVYVSYQSGHRQAIDLIRKKLTEEYVSQKDFVIFDSRKREFLHVSELFFLLSNKLNRDGIKFSTGLKLFSPVYDVYIPTWNTLIMIKQNPTTDLGANYFSIQGKIAALHHRKVVVWTEEEFLSLSDVQTKINKFDQMYDALKGIHN